MLEQQDGGLLLLSEDGRRHIQDMQAWLEPQMAPGGGLDWIREWTGKLAGQTARIAGLLHLADWAGNPVPVIVPGNTVERAVVLAKTYLLPQAEHAFSMMGQSETTAGARAILQAAVSHNQTEFSARQALEWCKGGQLKDMQAVRAALEALAQHNYIRAVASKPRTGPGRPPGDTFELHPDAARNIANRGSSGTALATQATGRQGKTVDYANYTNCEEGAYKSDSTAISFPRTTVANPQFAESTLHQPGEVVRI